MGLLEEGMLLAVRNFKAKRREGGFTLLEISAISPEHFGLRGLSDESYYPYQFEIIEQSVEDWETDDKATMMIQLLTIPLSYELTVDGGNREYVKGFTYPVVGERVYILNKAMIHRMYNRQVLHELGLAWNENITVPSSQEARKDPRLGAIKMFQEAPPPIPIYVSFDRLVRYHFGIFSFTGGGKSKLGRQHSQMNHLPHKADQDCYLRHFHGVSLPPARRFHRQVDQQQNHNGSPSGGPEEIPKDHCHTKGLRED